jgi:hypothetical protein
MFAKAATKAIEECQAQTVGVSCELACLREQELHLALFRLATQE